MASDIRLELMNAAAQLASTNGDSVHAKSDTTDFIAWQKATKNSGTSPTLDTVIQHSPDKVNWKTLATFTQVTTGTVTQAVQINSANTHVFPYVRAVTTLGGTTPNFDVLVELWAQKTDVS